MIRKVMLINPPGRCLIGRDGAITERKHCAPPLGLAYLAASLLRDGYKVTILDMLADGYAEERYTEQFVYYGLTVENAIERIRFTDPDMIGVSILFSNLAPKCYKLIHAIKERFPNKLIVLGGHHPSAMPLRVMQNPNVDFVLTGEADVTLVELCDSLNGKVPIDSVKGLYYRNDKEIIDTMAQVKPRVEGEDFKYFSHKDGPNPGQLEALPLPAWHLFPMEKYWASEVRQGGGDVQRERYGAMVATRGCPHVCYFCTSPLMGSYRGYRRRTLEDIIGEIRWLKDTFGIREIQFFDDNFFINRRQVKDLVKAIGREFPNMVFSVPAGAEVNMIDEELVNLLAEANFYRLTLAIESGNQEIQGELIDKHVDLDRIPRIVQYIKDKDIEVRGFFMIGFPGETRESILNTARFAMSLDLDDISFSVVTPLPGTPLCDECVERQLLVESFDPDDVRYSVSSIKIEGMTQEEIEDVRRKTWLEHQELKKAVKIRKPTGDSRMRMPSPPLASSRSTGLVSDSGFSLGFCIEG